MAVGRTIISHARRPTKQLQMRPSHVTAQLHTSAGGNAMSETAAPRGRSPQRYLQDDSGGTVQRPRIPDDTWIPALERCHEENRPIGHVLTDLLDLWLAGRIELEEKP